MKTNDILTLATVALLTATVTVATLLPLRMEADNETDAPAPKIPKPTLTCDGVELTLAAVDNRVFKEGEEPVFELKAVNTTDQPASVNAQMMMTSLTPSNPMSRMVSIATFWQDQRTLTLKPHETKVITVESNAKLPANSQISVHLAVEDAAKAANKPADQPASKVPVFARPSPSSIVAVIFSTVKLLPAAESVVTSK